MQNSDAIDGVKFVGTLDGKTCPYCASYDGYIWRGEEIAEARRPPIHPNCRCCLIPYVELKDDEGNIVDVDGERPAANADFDKLAQDAYNERAREKGWKRRWDDLSPSTRLKYYYQAQKDYEAETGKPAYRQVSGSTTFQEYFHRQPDSFKRAWLGAKRYELYKDGKLKEKNIFKPDLTYQVSAESLVRDGFRSVAQETVETIRASETYSTALLSRTDRNDPDTKEHEVEALETKYYSENDPEAEKKRKEAFDKYFPKDPNSPNIATARKLLPRRKHFKDVEYGLRAREGAKKGLNAVARICDYYGIDLSEIDGLTFEKNLIDEYSNYDELEHKIYLEKFDRLDGEGGAASTSTHEVGHPIEYRCFAGCLREELIAFYEKSTACNPNDNSIKYRSEVDDRDGRRFRILRINLPIDYAAKEYVDAKGNVVATELLSTFFQALYEHPELRDEEYYRSFFDGIKGCFERAKRKVRQRYGKGKR